MSDFLKKFLTEDPRRLQDGASRGIYLAAFGKHPGWDDHVEDLGLETESLILAKTRFYVQGIGSQIDSGEWEKLDAEQQLLAFKHVFVWQRGQQYLIGRLWASSDGKGRKRYPMIVCAHVLGAPLTWVLAEVLPVLESLEQECQSLTTSHGIRQLLDRKRQDLRQRLASLPEGTKATPLSPEAVSRFVDHPKLGPDQQGWHRLLYQMESQLHAYAPGQFNAKGDAVRPQQIRVPKCEAGVSESFRLWIRFFNEQIDPAVPLLLVMPLEADWVDATLGEPTAQEFFSLRASARKVPLVTEVPYNLDEAFRNRARAFLRDFQQGKHQTQTRAASDPGTTTFLKQSGGKSGWLKWLVGGAGVILILGALVFMLLKPQDQDSARRDPLASNRNAVESGLAGSSDASPVSSLAEETNVPPAVPPTEVEEEERAAQLAAELDEERKRLAMAQAEEEARLKAEAEVKAQEEAARLQAEQEALAAKKAAEEEAARRQAELKRQAEEQARQEELARQEKAKQEELARMEAAKKAAEEEARLKAEAEAKARAAATASTTSQPGGAGGSGATKFLTNSVGMVFVGMPNQWWVAKFEVTQGQFEKVMGSNPSEFRDDPNRPVESVSWTQAVDFCQKLTGQESEAGTLPPGMQYSLPTRQQWESFLAGASLDEAVTSRITKHESTSPVGSVAANDLGLHDVLGNVWEWCLDNGSPGLKYAMGGSYITSRIFAFKPFEATSSREETPQSTSKDLGFRCVLVEAK